jgi:hypothetical protein
MRIKEEGLNALEEAEKNKQKVNCLFFLAESRIQNCLKIRLLISCISKDCDKSDGFCLQYPHHCADAPRHATHPDVSCDVGQDLQVY